MSVNQKITLPTNLRGLPITPDPIPTNPDDLLVLMDEAAKYAEGAQGSGAPLFDQAMRVFDQLNAHYQTHMARDLGSAHKGLITATNALKAATWWLAIITFILGAVELWKIFIP